MIRVVAGKYRSRLLMQPPKEVTRPVQDLVKGAIFSMIQFKIEKSVVLDLFSGSGSIAIEFVSRDATKVIAIEKNREAIEVIHKNIAALEISNLQVIHADVITFLPRLANTKYDFIFLDPPYDRPDLLDETLRLIAALNLTKPLAYIIIKCASTTEVVLPTVFMIQKRKLYGDTMILLVTNII